MRLNETMSGRPHPVAEKDRLSMRSWLMTKALLDPHHDEIKEQWDRRTPMIRIARQFPGLTHREIAAYAGYYEWDKPAPRVKTPAAKAVNMDALAERIWMNIEPKVSAMIWAAMEQSTAPGRMIV